MSFIPNTNSGQSNTKEIRFNGYGHEMHLGHLVWTRKLFGAITHGCRERYGQSTVIEKTPRRVMLRHAKQDYYCSSCGQKINKDDMHGSEFYEHYCLDCVTPFEPKAEVEFKW